MWETCDSEGVRVKSRARFPVRRVRAELETAYRPVLLRMTSPVSLAFAPPSLRMSTLAESTVQPLLPDVKTHSGVSEEMVR